MYLIAMKSKRSFNIRERRVIMAELIRYLVEGFSVSEACRSLGLSTNTFYQWAVKDQLFKRAVDAAKERGGKALVEKSLHKLARGANEEELTEQWVGVKVVEGEEVPCSFSRKYKTKAPSEKAVALLAAKYAPEYTDKGGTKELTIKITQKDRTLSMEERLNLLKSDKEDTIDVTDFKHLGELAGSDLDE